MSGAPAASRSVGLFIVGRDYHLGDLLWLTAVLRAYREMRSPERIVVALPDRPISRVLELCPLIDELTFMDDLKSVRASQFGERVEVIDLRPAKLAVRMVREWRRRLPWLYYRDLWLKPRGQWLATLLGVGEMREYRPCISLEAHDFDDMPRLPERFVVLAPSSGRYTIRVLGAVWSRVKLWPIENWVALATKLAEQGLTPVTLGTDGDRTIEGAESHLGLQLRTAVAVISQAEALVTVESGLWFVAAAVNTPVVIVPWWLPGKVNWVAPTNALHRLLRRAEATPARVMEAVGQLVTMSDSSVRMRQR
jgi:hypothetical protein